MRTRTRSDEPHARPEQPNREETRQVRVPKIQYRFLKELEERGVNGETRVSALAMADKIKRYPLEASHVMASWERFTKKAIDDFKAGRGENAARDRQHLAYAVVFEAIKERRQTANVGELKQHIEVFSVGHPPLTSAREKPRTPEPPRQQSLLETQRAPDRQVENSLTILRRLPPQLRTTVESAAREAIIEGQTAKGAREEMPAATRNLSAERNEQNTVRALTLAVVANTAEHRVQLREVGTLPPTERREIEAEVRGRLERYPAAEAGLADLRRDAIDAAIHDAMAPSPAAHREALVLASAREELECIADPKRLEWGRVADELARDLA
jgi:hypothetical protein